MTEIPEEPSGDQLDPDLPEQGIDTGATGRPDDETTPTTTEPQDPTSAQRPPATSRTLPVQ